MYVCMYTYIYIYIYIDRLPGAALAGVAGVRGVHLLDGVREEGRTVPVLRGAGLV